MAFDFNTFGSTTDTSVKPTSSGFDLSSFGQSTQTQTNPKDNVTKGTIGGVADFLGIEKFGRGIGQQIANKEGVQDKLIAIHDQSLAITNQLINKIKSNKAIGKDTTRLQSALDGQLKSNSEFLNTISDVGTGGLTNKEVIGSALSTAALFAPGVGKNTELFGSKLLAKVAGGAGAGYAMDVAQHLQDNKKIGDALTPGMGTITGAVIPLALNIFGKGATIEQINQRLTPTEKKTLGTQGKEVAQYLVDNRVVGTPEQRLAKVNGLYTNMEENIQNIVNSSQVSYQNKEVNQALQDIKGYFIDKPAEYQTISNKIDEVTKFFQENAPESIPAPMINNFKRSLADSAYNEKGNKVLSEGYKVASDVLYSFLKDTIPGLKPLNVDYSKIITAKNLLETAASRSQVGLLGKTAALLTGSAIGGAVGGVGGAGVGSFVAPSIANAVATPIRSTIGLGLNEVNSLLNKIPIDKVGNLQISRKALIRLLTK